MSLAQSTAVKKDTSGASSSSSEDVGLDDRGGGGGYKRVEDNPLVKGLSDQLSSSGDVDDVDDDADDWTASFSAAGEAMAAVLTGEKYAVEGSYAAFLHGAELTAPPSDIDVLAENMASCGEKLAADARFKDNGGSLVVRKFEHKLTGIELELKHMGDFAKVDETADVDGVSIRTPVDTMCALIRRPEFRWKDKVALASLVLNDGLEDDAARLKVANTAESEGLISGATWAAMSAWAGGIMKLKASGGGDDDVDGGAPAELTAALDQLEEDYADGKLNDDDVLAVIKKLLAEYSGNDAALSAINEKKDELL